MDNRESKAAAMRQTWLGDAAGEAVPWNELKQCVRDRWLAALDAAQPEGAALAAVGPQYCPADVAFSSRVPELESKIDNQRMTLRQLHNLREKERAERNILERELDEARAERYGLKKRNEIQAEQLIRIDREISPLMSEVARLKAELDAARAELAALKAQPGGWELDVPENGWLADGFCIYNPSTGEGHSLESFVSHVCSRIRPVAPRAYTDADVEKLARAMHSKTRWLSWDELIDAGRESWRESARAALDWMGAPVGECKECEKNKAELRRHNDKWTGFIQRCQTDAQNARAALEGE